MAKLTNTTIYGSLQVTNDTDLASLSTTGKATLSSLEVTNAAKLDNSVTVLGALSVDDMVTVDGDISVVTALSSGTETVHIDHLTGVITGNLSGNATTATTAAKLGSSSLGSSTTPIYLDGGSPIPCTSYADASVNSASTATTAKNYDTTEGNIQIQFADVYSSLSAKAPTVSPTFAGTVKMPFTSSGLVKTTNDGTLSVDTTVYAKLDSSPTFTGTVTAPAFTGDLSGMSTSTLKMVEEEGSGIVDVGMGNSTTPVFFSNGVPSLCTPYANASVSSAVTATTATDYSSAGGIAIALAGKVSTTGAETITGTKTFGTSSAYVKIDPTATIQITATGGIKTTSGFEGSLTGDVTGTASKATSDVDGKAIKTTYAKIASPTFTGTVTAPTFIGALSGNATSATTATKLSIATDASGVTYYPVLSTTSTSGSSTGYVDSGFYFTKSPETGNPIAMSFGGTIVADSFAGNATTASSTKALGASYCSTIDGDSITSFTTSNFGCDSGYYVAFYQTSTYAISATTVSGTITILNGALDGAADQYVFLTPVKLTISGSVYLVYSIYFRAQAIERMYGIKIS